MARFLYIFLSFLLLYIQGSYSQRVTVSECYGAVSTDSVFHTHEEAYKYAKSIIPSLQSKGYLTSGIDSFSITDTFIRLYIFKGEQYKWAAIRTDSIPDEVLAESNINIEKYRNKEVSPQQIAALSERLLQYAETKGYPFASVYFSQPEFSENNGISALLIFDKGEQQKIDSINIVSEMRISKSFLLKYLDLQEGMTYHAGKLGRINRLLGSLPYLQQEKEWELSLGLMKKELNLYLKERKANQANAILGLQPSNTEDRRLQVTADVLLSFYNAIGYGEHLSLKYQQLQYRSPRFNASATWPYLFGTNFGVTGTFDLFQLDTTFRRTTANLGVIYQLSADNYLKLFYELQSSRAITFDTQFIKTNKKLPPNIDVKSNGIGVTFQYSTLNNPLNPRSGFMAQVTAIGAKRAVLKNNAISAISDAGGFDYNTLYDTIRGNPVQSKIRTSASLFLPVLRSATLRIGYENGFISGSNLFRNELYQIGGFKLLRGFNEQSIYSRHFHIASIEPRILVSDVSYIYLFSDVAYLETLGLNNEALSNWAYSFGIGGTLETKSGIFNIAFAVGKQGAEKLQFRNTRVHFGYSVYF